MTKEFFLLCGKNSFFFTAAEKTAGSEMKSKADAGGFFLSPLRCGKKRGSAFFAVSIIFLQNKKLIAKKLSSKQGAVLPLALAEAKLKVVTANITSCDCGR